MIVGYTTAAPQTSSTGGEEGGDTISPESGASAIGNSSSSFNYGATQSEFGGVFGNSEDDGSGVGNTINGEFGGMSGGGIWFSSGATSITGAYVGVSTNIASTTTVVTDIGTSTFTTQTGVDPTDTTTSTVTVVSSSAGDTTIVSTDTFLTNTNTVNTATASGTFDVTETGSIPISTSVGTTTNGYQYSTETTSTFSVPTIIPTFSGSGTNTTSYYTTSTTQSTYSQTTATFGTKDSTFIDSLTTKFTQSLLSIDFVNYSYFLAPNEIAWILTVSELGTGKALTDIAKSTTGSFTLPNQTIASALNIPTVNATGGEPTTQQVISNTTTSYTSMGVSSIDTPTSTLVGANGNTEDTNSTTNTKSSTGVPNYIPNSSWTTTINITSTFEDTISLNSEFVTDSNDSGVVNQNWVPQSQIVYLNIPTTCYILASNSDGIPTGFTVGYTQTTIQSTLSQNVAGPVAISDTENDGSGDQGSFKQNLGITTTTNKNYYGMEVQSQLGSQSVLTPQKSEGVCLPDGYITGRDPYQQITLAEGLTLPAQFVFGVNTSIFTPVPILGSTSTLSTDSSQGSTSYSVSWSSLSLSVTMSQGSSTDTTTSSFTGVLGVTGPIQNPQFLLEGPGNLGLGGAQIDSRGLLLFLPGQALLDITLVDGSNNNGSTSIDTEGQTVSFDSTKKMSAISTFPLYNVIPGTNGGVPFFVVTGLGVQ
jgi:hypothetical protein